jgi:hypothetical protein
VQVTDDERQFRFVGLPPGTYQLKAGLIGFNTSEDPKIVIGADRDTTITVTLEGTVA